MYINLSIIKKTQKIAFLCIVIILCCIKKDTYANEVKKDKFNATDIIMSHIADSHEFHIWGHGNNAVSLPLPVILKTKSGIKIFSSAMFHHDNQGKHLVHTGGENFVRYKNKIYFANKKSNKQGEYLNFKDDKPLNSTPLDFSITKNAATMLVSAILMCIIFIFSALSYKKTKHKAPKGIQSLLEPVITFVQNEAKTNIGSKYRKFVPYLLTLFFFILINNLLGLIPIFPGGSNVMGNISVTLVLGFITFIVTNFNGNKHYWKEIFRPHVPIALYPIMWAVEIIGIFSKPFALIIRLFANITAGHIVILSLISLIFIFKSIAVAPISVIFSLFMYVLELLVAFLQAFIFTMLSALFIGLAVKEESEHNII